MLSDVVSPIQCHGACIRLGDDHNVSCSDFGPHHTFPWYSARIRDQISSFANRVVRMG